VEKVSFPNTGVLDDDQHFLSMWHLPSFNVGFTFISDRFGPYPVSAIIQWLPQARALDVRFPGLSLVLVPDPIGDPQ